MITIGPDNNPRSFELFWKGDTGPRSVALRPSRLLFDRKHTLVWEADAPEDLLVETVRIDVDVLQTMGTGLRRVRPVFLRSLYHAHT
jgi:hypothetical protein